MSCCSFALLVLLICGVMFVPGARASASGAGSEVVRGAVAGAGGSAGVGSLCDVV